MSEYKLLNRINSPADLKAMQEDEIKPLAEEIRQFLVEKVTQNGGHLASNLGVVELTLAIHRVFDVPSDHLIFDVSHQSYVHKILTGRRDEFDTLRKGSGLSGFMKRSESEYDCFGAGHSSTSVSAGLGFAQADKLHKNDATTIVVLGDGAFTGGMVHEALNNIDPDLKLVIILNENEMSISKNIGTFANILTKLRLHPRYIETKNIFRNILTRIPLIGKPTLRILRNVKKRVKDTFYGSNYFENLGLFYIGPIDGNNEKQVEDALRIAKAKKESVIIHAKTVKGKGYEPAEQNPALYHGISPKDAKVSKSSFSAEFGKSLMNIANDDNRVCAITAAMLDGTGLNQFAAQFPDRTFDVGIAEEHALTFACGLAADGMKPYFAVYSTFLQRSYDNIIHDMALQNLPVRICIDRAGLNPGDGPTHHGIYDVAFLSQLPNITLYDAVTYKTLNRALSEMNELTTPCAVRYPRGGEAEAIVAEFNFDTSKDLSIRTNFDSADDLDGIVITHGSIVKEAIKAKNILAKEGIKLGIILVERIMPYASLVEDIADILPQKSIKIVTLEEEIKAGGFGMMLLDKMSSMEIIKNKKSAIIALEDTFADNYSDDIYKSMGLDAESIAETVRNM